MSDDLQSNSEQDAEKALEEALQPDTEQPEKEEDGADDTLEFLDGEQKQDKSTRSTVSASQKAKQIDAWTQKILDGEKDLNDLPPSQKWIKPFIEQNLQEIRSNQDVEALVERKLAEKELVAEQLELERKFLDAVQSVKEMDLDNSEKAILAKKYKGLQSVGVPREVALTEALDYVKLYKDMDDSNKRNLRKAMSIPRLTPRKTDEPGKMDLNDPNFAKRGTAQDRVAMYENRLKQAGFTK